MSGYVAISRDLWNDPDFDREPMSQREAWIWLIAEAAWKPHKVRRNNAVIELQRGQLAHSIRFMAEAWGWHRARVDRFLKTLKNRDMIETAVETGVNVITICKYDKYQNGKQAAETPVNENRDTSETNYNQDNHKNHVRGAPRLNGSPPFPDSNSDRELMEKVAPAFERFWQAYPKGANRGGKKPALREFFRKAKAGVDPDRLVASARAYAKSLNGSEYFHAAHRWISEEHWENVEGAVIAAPPDPDSLTDQQWTSYVGYFHRNGRWKGPGPQPNHPGCLAPKDVLANHGYRQTPEPVQ